MHRVLPSPDADRRPALLIKMQTKIDGQLIDCMANKLLEFVKSYYDNLRDDYQHAIADLLKKKAA